MDWLATLWVPIVVSAVAVFIVSSIVHMALPIHKGDHPPFPDGDVILEAMRRAGLRPGTYSFPGCDSMKEMGTPETLAKYEKGPVGYATVMPNGAPSIGKNLLQWFALSLGIGALTAYAAYHSLPAGAPTEAVLRITGCVAIAGYALGAFQDSIWKGVPWRISVKFAFDGFVYGLTTAGVFVWLWPAAA